MAASGLCIPTPPLFVIQPRYQRSVPESMLDVAVVAAVSFSEFLELSFERINFIHPLTVIGKGFVNHRDTFQSL